MLFDPRRLEEHPPLCSGSRLHDEAENEEDRRTRKEDRQDDHDGWSSRHFFRHSSATPTLAAWAGLFSEMAL
jgi:hypothetical protein